MPDTEGDLLKEIRENYREYEEGWREIRQEAQKDMRYISGDPWEPEERQARKNAQRPVLSLDELTQYVNALVNDPKQNKRAIQVNPEDEGADEKTGELRANIIRGVEYQSRAQVAYTTAFQGAVERSYGYFGINARYKAPDSFDQELYIRRIPNPDSVLFSPTFSQIDASDAMGCFVTDVMSRKEFKRKYPKAKVVDFVESHETEAPQWIRKGDVQVGEYWRVTVQPKKLLMVKYDGAKLPVVHFEDELPKGKHKVLDERDSEKRIVTQYITNGIEILDETELPIPWIPIVPVFGKEIYVNEGGGSKRKLLSLIRLARDPYMLYCYYRTCEAELVAMTPKTPYIGYVGQFNTDKKAWQNANKVPVPYLQVDAVADAAAGRPLPIPQRQPYDPAIQPLEIGAESARRAIQAAMGISPLPTSAQRINEKSGKALEQIESQEQRGSFHFIDNYNIALEHAGRIMDKWIRFVYPSARNVGIRKPDGSYQSIRINDPSSKEAMDAKRGRHNVTISVGPSFESQRAEASDFVDTLIQNLQAIPPVGSPQAKLLALAIRLKQLGPLGEEMANTISPPQNEQEAQNAIAQGQQQLAQQQKIIAEMQAELEKLRLEKAGKVIDNQYALEMQRLQNDIKVLIAEIQAKAQDQLQRTEMFMEFWKENHGSAHEAAMQAADQQHEQQMAANNAAIAAAQASAGNATPAQEEGNA